MRVALVVQRYGPEVNGGAEYMCRLVAERLTLHHDVHVITTCALDYLTWKNHYPPGEERLNGVRVYRFPVDHRRNPHKFRRQTLRLLSQPGTLFDQVKWMRSQGPYSTPLFRFILEQRDDFDAYLFFTYLYATTYFGIQLVPEKAALVPTAHDEPLFYLDLFRPLFHLPRFLVYNTEAERRLVVSTYANEHIPNAVVGAGVHTPSGIDGTRFRHKHDLAQLYILYVGRIDNAKNCSELFEFFMRYKTERPGDLKLVLIGKATIPVPQHPDILSLGFVSEQDKYDGMAAASALIMPSLYESLSLVLLESWAVATPVLVNANCEALRENCERSGGGLSYRDFNEFRDSLQRLIDDPHAARQMGKKGQRYVADHYSWERIDRQYLKILEHIQGSLSNSC